MAHVWNPHAAGTMRTADASSRRAEAAEQEKKEKNKTQTTKKQGSSLPLPNGINTQINNVRIVEILPKGYVNQVHKCHILKS